MQWTSGDLGPAVYFDMDVEPDGTPHIVYTNCTHRESCFGVPATRYLMHTVKTDGTWATDTLAADPAGFTPAVTLDDTGGVHIVYTDSLYHMQYLYGTAGGPWVKESLPHSGPGYFRNEPDIAVDDTGGVHVSYNERERPWYQYRSGTGWTEEQVSWNYADNDLARSSIRVGSDGVVRLAYWSFAYHGTLYEKSGGVWTENVIGLSWGQFPSLALDAGNNAHILYTGFGGAFYASNETGAWTEDTLDVNGSWGDLVLTADETPVVTYPTAVAFFDSLVYYQVDLYISDRAEGYWRRESVVSYTTPAVGGAGILFRPRLGVDDSGTLHLAYTHPVTGVLVYGRGDVPTPATQPSAGISPRLGVAPNPFNPSTTILISVPSAGRVTIEIFDVRGRRVGTLVDRRFDAGSNRLAWNGRDESGTALPSGVYFCRMTFAGSTLTRKITLIQ